MTTIVYCKGVFAWESRITSGGSIVTDKGVKRFKQGGCTFYMAGDTSDWPKLRDAYLNGTDHGPLECAAFVVGPDKIPYRIATNDDNGKVWRSELSTDDPYAIGSGSDHAITAVDCGCSPRDAVKMAIKRDKSSGGTIRVESI